MPEEYEAALREGGRTYGIGRVVTLCQAGADRRGEVGSSSSRAAVGIPARSVSPNL